MAAWAAGLLSAVYLALLFLAPVALPLGPWDVGGTVRAETPGSAEPPQGFSSAVTTWLPDGRVGQYSWRLGDRSIVITWSERKAQVK